MKHITETTKEYLGLIEKRENQPKPVQEFSHSDIKKTLDYTGITREEKKQLSSKNFF